jgi:2'-5' RNA ligase
MFTQSKIAAITFASSLVFASAAQAQDVSLETYVSNMVNQNMLVAQYEFKNTLREAVLTVANNVSFDEEKPYMAHVTITDLASKNVEVVRHSAE